MLCFFDLLLKFLEFYDILKLKTPSASANPYSFPVWHHESYHQALIFLSEKGIRVVKAQVSFYLFCIGVGITVAAQMTAGIISADITA